MDALDELDLIDCDEGDDVVSGGGGNAAHGPSLVKRELADEPVTALQPSSKRRRGTASGGVRVKSEPGQHSGGSHMMNRPVKADGVKLEAVVALGTGDDEGGDDEATEKICIGCRRSSEVGTCFISSTPVAWGLPGSRGNWCRDCHNVWRLMYQSKTTLLLFALWLRIPANMREFELVLVAYLSLKREGIERLSEATVLQRRDTLKFILRMLCLPSGPFEVKPLTEVPGDKIEAIRLVPFVSAADGGERRLCYMADVDDDDGVPTVPRPLDHTWLGSALRQGLTVTSTADLEKLQKIFNTQLVPCSSGKPCPVDGHSAAEQADLGKRQKLSLVLSWAACLLQPFASDNWQTLKESSFTSVIAKVSSYKTTEASKDDVDHIVPELTAWGIALARGKTFVAKHKRWNKIPKIAALLEMVPAVSQWGDFMKSEGIKVHKSFELVRFKAEYSSAAPGAYTEKLTTVLAAGLQPVLHDMALKDAPAVDGWLRGTIFTRFACTVDLMQVDDCDKMRSIFFKDFLTLVSLLRNLPFHTAIAEFVNDVDCLRILMEAGTEKHSLKAADAKRCTDALESSRFALLRKTFDESSCGQEFMTGIADLLTRNANDELGDNRFKQATGTLTGPGVFYVMLPHPSQEAEQGIKVVNCSLILGPGADPFGLLATCIQSLLDACSLWSPVRLDEQAALVQGFLGKVYRGAVAIDTFCAFGLLRHSVATLCSGSVDFGLSVKAEVNDEWDILPYNRNTDDFLANMKDSAVISKQATLFCKHLARVDKVFDWSAEILTLSTIISETVQHNLSVRSKVAEFLETCSGLADTFGKTPQTLLEDWRERHNSSDLCKILDFTAACNDLDKAFRLVPKTVEHPDNMTLKVFDGDLHGFSCSQKMSDVENLPLLLSGMSSAVSARSTVEQIGAEAMAAFGRFCELDGLLMQHSSHVFDEMQPAMAVGTLVDIKKMENTVITAGKFFRNNGNDDVIELLGTVAFQMADEVLGQCSGSDVAVPLSLVLSECKVSKSEVLAFAALYQKLVNLAGALLFLADEVKEPIVEHVVRQPLLKAFSFAKAELESIAAWRASSDTGRSLVLKSATQWRWSLTAAEAWLTNASTVLGRLQVQTFRAVIVDLTEFGNEVHTALPRTEHFANDKVFAKAVAKTKLMKVGLKDRISTLAVAFCRCLQAIGSLSVTLNIPAPQDSDEYREPIQAAELHFASAKGALTLLAAAQVIFALKGPEQIKEAERVLVKEDLLPKSVARELKIIVQGST